MDFFKSASISFLFGLIAVLFILQRNPGMNFQALFLIFIAGSWLAFSLTSPSRFMAFVGYLQNPPMAALISFLGVFTYMSYRSFSFSNSLIGSFIAALFGGLAGVVLFNYWNIGS